MRGSTRRSWVSLVMLCLFSGSVQAQMTQDDLDFLQQTERCNRLRAQGDLRCSFERSPKRQTIPQPFFPGSYQQQQQFNRGLEQLQNTLEQLYVKPEQPSSWGLHEFGQQGERLRGGVGNQGSSAEPDAFTPEDITRWRDMQLEVLKALSPPSLSTESPKISSLSISDARWDASPPDVGHDEQVQRVLDQSLSKALNMQGGEGISFSDSLAVAYNAIAAQRSENSTDPVLRDAEYFLLGYRSAIDRDLLMSISVVGSPVYNAIKTLANKTGNEWLKAKMRSDKDKPNAPPGGTEWAYYGLYLGLTRGASATEEFKKAPLLK